MHALRLVSSTMVDPWTSEQLSQRLTADAVGVYNCTNPAYLGRNYNTEFYSRCMKTGTGAFDL